MLVLACIGLGFIAFGCAIWAIRATEQADYWKWMWEGELSVNTDRESLKRELAGIEREIDEHKSSTQKEAVE